MSFVNSVVGGPADATPAPAIPLLLPWEDYKEKAKELRIKGSITDILRDNIFEISQDDRNFLTFTKHSDTDLYEFDFDEKVPLIMAVMEQDVGLGKVYSRLVPRQTTEALFWKSYFYTVELVRDQTLLKFSTTRPSSDLDDLKIKSDKHRELMDELESELTAEPQIVIKEKKPPREPVAVTELQRQLKAALARIEQLEKRVAVLETQQKLGSSPKEDAGEVPPSVSPLD